MPAVNYDLMRQSAIREAKGAEESDRLFDPNCRVGRTETLTPNPDAVYLMPFFNTRALTESRWCLKFRPPATKDRSPADIDNNVAKFPLEDVGPAGVDKTKGGKFLVLPPGYKDKVAPKGVTPRFPPKPTAAGFRLLQLNSRGAGPTPTSQKRSPTASASNSIP